MKSREIAHTWNGVLAFALAATVATIGGPGCGGGDGGGPNHVDNPTPAAGGGVSGPVVLGELNVFVVDSVSKQPIQGANVTVVIAGDAPDLTGTTAAMGLATITDDALDGAQEIAVSAAGHVPATWFGANGAVVTIPLNPTAAPPAADSAQVSGTIEGWADLPAPALGHFTIALVLYSFTKDLDAPDNQIQQPMPAPQQPPANSCVRAPGVQPPCSWSLHTRTGLQTHYAIIADVDTKGTAENTDDTFTVIGFAGKSGVNLAADQTLTNETLTMVDAADIADLAVMFPALAPVGLGELGAFPIMQLGDERLIFFLPGITPEAATVSVPEPVGEFAGASWTLIAQAKGSSGAADPSSTIFKHAIDLTAPVDLGEFLALPSGLMAGSDGMFSYTGAAGASVHSADILDADAKLVWNGLILDGRTQFTPDASGTLLGTGSFTFKMGAVKIAGFDPGSFAIDDLIDSLDQLSSQIVSFQH